MDERVDLIDGVVYADLFDCAATAEEVWRYCRRSVARDELLARLHDDPGLSALIRERDGLYCLRGRETLLDARVGRRRRALGPGDVYVARELAQSQPRAGRGRDLVAANRWTAALLPNVGSGPRAEVAPLPGGRLVQRLIERPLRGRLGDAVEARLGRLALARVASHHRRFGSAPPADVLEAFRHGVEL